MENGTLMAGAIVSGRSTRMRVSAVLAALALVLTMFVLVQQRADAATTGGSTAVAASVASVGAGDAAQINFNQIICAALISIRNSFANSPFFSFVAAIINQFIVAFGCAPS
jgi:hypothetical protein